MSNDFWDGYEPEPSKPAPVKGEGMISDPDEYDWKCGCALCEVRYKNWKSDYDVQQAALRNEALNKKAENARELGLDYEPEERYTYGTPLLDAFTKPTPVQEPVAYLCENAVGHKYFRWKKPSSEFKPIALYTTPPAAQRQWVGLTDEVIHELWVNSKTGANATLSIARKFARAIEAKLKEKNNG